MVSSLGSGIFLVLILLQIAPLHQAFRSYTPKTTLPVAARHEGEIDLHAASKRLAPNEFPTFEHSHELLKTLELGHKTFEVHTALAHANTTAKYVIQQDLQIVHLDKAQDVVSISDSHVEHCNDYSQAHVEKIQSTPTYVIGTLANLRESSVVKAWGSSKNMHGLHKTRGLLVLRKITSMELHHHKENGCAVLNTSPVLHFELFEHLSIHSVGSTATLRESAKAHTTDTTLRSRKLDTDPWFIIDSPLIDCSNEARYKNNGPWAFKLDPVSPSDSTKAGTVGDSVMYYLGLTMGCAQLQMTLVSFSWNYDMTKNEVTTPTLTIPGVSGISCKDCYAYLGAGFELFLEYNPLVTDNKQPSFAILFKLGGKAGYNAAVSIVDPVISGAKTGNLIAAATSYGTPLSLGGGMSLYYKSGGLDSEVSGSGSATGSASMGAGASFSGYLGVTYLHDIKAGFTGTRGFSFPYAATFAYTAPYFTTTGFTLKNMAVTLAVTGKEILKLSYSGYIEAEFQVATTGNTQFQTVSAASRRLLMDDIPKIIITGSKFYPGDVVPISIQYSGFNPSETTVVFYSVEVLGVSEWSVMTKSFVSSASGSGVFEAEWVVPWNRQFAGDGTDNVRVTVRISNDILQVLVSDPLAFVMFTETDGIFTKPRASAVLPVDQQVDVEWDSSLLKFHELEPGALYKGAERISTNVNLFVSRELVWAANSSLLTTINSQAATNLTNAGHASVMFPQDAIYFQPPKLKVPADQLVSKYYLTLRSTNYANIQSWSSGYVTFSHPAVPSAAVIAKHQAFSHKALAFHARVRQQARITTETSRLGLDQQHSSHRKLEGCGSSTVGTNSGAITTGSQASGALNTVSIVRLTQSFDAAPSPVSLGSPSLTCMANIAIVPVPTLLPTPLPTPIPTSSPTVAAEVSRIGFTLVGLSVSPNKVVIQQALSKALNIASSQILSVLIDGARRNLDATGDHQQQLHRKLFSSSIQATISFPTTAAVSTFSSASSTTILASIVTEYNTASGASTTSTGDLTVENVTPTATPTDTPTDTPTTTLVAAPDTSDNTIVIGVAAGLGLIFAGGGGWWYYRAHLTVSNPKYSPKVAVDELLPPP